MKRVLVMASTGAMVLAIFGLVAAAAGTTKTAAPQARPQAFVVEGKVLDVSGDSLELSVTRVVRGVQVKVGQRLKIMEGAKTRFLAKGKTVTKDAVKAGQQLRVEGQRPKPAVYEATRITILK
jgi:phage tail sheath protein FI